MEHLLVAPESDVFIPLSIAQCVVGSQSKEASPRKEEWTWASFVIDHVIGKSTLVDLSGVVARNPAFCRLVDIPIVGIVAHFLSLLELASTCHGK